MSVGDSDYIEETDAEADAADLAGEQWGDYNERFVPLENQLMSRIASSRDQRPLATGRAANTVTQAFDDNYNINTARNTSRGADPSSGAAMMGLSDTAVAEAGSRSNAVVGADRAVENNYYNGQQQVVSMGQGLSGDASMAVQSTAGISAETARSDAAADATVTNAMVGAAGTAVGLGTRGYMNRSSGMPGLGTADDIGNGVGFFDDGNGFRSSWSE